MPAPHTRATAFGLDVLCDSPVAFLAGARAAPTGRRLSLSVAPHERARERWPGDAQLICDETQPDGSINFRIEKSPQAGYLLWGPAYGAHLLASDGSALSCFPEDLPDGAWQRFLIAQVLPFAALLQGLEVLHASAVSQRGSAVAFLGPSGSGKTSLALELCSRGADFLADDVLALERSAGGLLAHAGSPVAGVARDRPHTPGPVLASNEREQVVALPGAAAAAPLEAMFFIERRSDGPSAPSFTAVTDGISLLAATFNFVLAGPERLAALLDVSAIAARRRVELITAGPATDTSALADAVQARLAQP
jgi:hypothetical protein